VLSKSLGWRTFGIKLSRPTCTENKHAVAHKEVRDLACPRCLDAKIQTDLAGNTFYFLGSSNKRFRKKGRRICAAKFTLQLLRMIRVGIYGSI